MGSLKCQNAVSAQTSLLGSVSSLQADFASSALSRELHIKFHLQGRIIFAVMPGRQGDALAFPEGFTAADAEKEKTQHDFQV